jgi:hypothetical protein
MPPAPLLLLPDDAASEEGVEPEDDPLEEEDVDVDVGDVPGVPPKPESSPEVCALPASPLLEDPPRHAGSEKSPRTSVETPAFKIRSFTSHLVIASRNRRAWRLIIRAPLLPEAADEDGAPYHHIVALIPKTFSSGGKPLFGGCGVTPLL